MEFGLWGAEKKIPHPLFFLLKFLQNITLGAENSLKISSGPYC